MDIKEAMTPVEPDRKRSGWLVAAAAFGAVIIVGGNIAHVTRVMTTAIALETSKGDLPLALGLGVVLLLTSLFINGAAALSGHLSQRALT